MDDPVDDRHRQRAVIPLVDGDVAGLLVRHDMLVEVAVKRATFGVRDGGEEGGVVGGGAGRDHLHDRLLSVLNDRSGASGGRGRVKDREATAKRRWGSRFSSAARTPKEKRRA